MKNIPASNIPEGNSDRIKINTVSNSRGIPEHVDVIVGTTRKGGGDSGHGGRIYLKLFGGDSADFRVRTSANAVEIIVGGDWEMDSFIESLEFAVSVLEKQMSGLNTVEVE